MPRLSSFGRYNQLIFPLCNMYLRVSYLLWCQYFSLLSPPHHHRYHIYQIVSPFTIICFIMINQIRPPAPPSPQFTLHLPPSQAQTTWIYNKETSSPTTPIWHINYIITTNAIITAIITITTIIIIIINNNNSNSSTYNIIKALLVVTMLHMYPTIWFISWYAHYTG